jgi:hypothetical protein
VAMNPMATVAARPGPEVPSRGAIATGAVMAWLQF